MRGKLYKAPVRKLLATRRITPVQKLILIALHASDKPLTVYEANDAIGRQRSSYAATARDARCLYEHGLILIHVERRWSGPRHQPTRIYSLPGVST